MMKFKILGMHAEEMHFRMNVIKADPDTKFEIKPQFNRNLKKIKELPKRRIAELVVRVESTNAEPKPFDLNIKLVAVFELEDEIWLVEEEKEFAAAATRIMFPYLRATVASLTTAAMMPPLQLPVIDGGIMFPEDRPAEADQESSK